MKPMLSSQHPQARSRPQFAPRMATRTANAIKSSLKAVSIDKSDLSRFWWCRSGLHDRDKRSTRQPGKFGAVFRLRPARVPGKRPAAGAARTGLESPPPGLVVGKKNDQLADQHIAQRLIRR